MKISTLLILLFLVLAGMPSCSLQSDEFNLKTAKKIEKKAWEKLPDILARIVEPDILDNRILLTDFGAKGDSLWDCLPAFRDAISRLAASGGGILVVPAGQYYIDGPIHLQSNINLHLEKDARIFFSNIPESYLPAVKVRWEGTVCYNYSPLIYGIGLKNVAFTGEGEIDGAAEGWSREWRKKQNPDKATLRQMGNDKVPEEQRVFANGFLDMDGDGMDDGFGDGEEHFLRPTLIEFYECENVLVEGLIIRNSPFWTVHPVFSKNVILRNLKIYGKTTNDDGIDPDSSEDLLIEGCEIRTHDDAISIKAGRDQDAWDRPGSRNIIVRNNNLYSGVNAICVGSEMSGGVENVFVYENKIANGKNALNFKCNLDRGGQVQKIFIRDIEIESCNEAMFIFRMDYHGYRGNNFPTKFNDFYVSGIHCKEVKQLPFKVVGVEDEPITRVLFRDIQIESAGEESVLEYASDILFSGVLIEGVTFSGISDN